jgi:hypothetical protein
VVTHGWHLLPRGVFRVATYPVGTRKLRLDLTGERAAHSREGSKIEAGWRSDYTIAEERVLDLHRRTARATRPAGSPTSCGAPRPNGSPRCHTTWCANATGAAAVGARRRGKGDRSGGITIGSLRIAQVAGVGESAGAIARAGVEPISAKWC